MNFLDIIFPKVCKYCGKIGEYICDDCYNKFIKKYEYNYCKNGKFFIYKYDGELRELLLKYKFRDESYLREFFANSITKNKKLYIFFNQYDIIVPVPLHRKRKLERGYNQTEEILKFAINNFNSNSKIKNIIQNNSQINTRTNNKNIRNDNIKFVPKIEYNSNILIKTKNIKPQSTKNEEERKENIKNAFEIKNEQAKKVIKNKKILVFDDIYTTGSTFNECKNVLMRSGAKSVGALMIARD